MKHIQLLLLGFILSIGSLNAQTYDSDKIIDVRDYFSDIDQWYKKETYSNFRLKYNNDTHDLKSEKFVCNDYISTSSSSYNITIVASMEWLEEDYYGVTGGGTKDVSRTLTINSVASSVINPGNPGGGYTPPPANTYHRSYTVVDDQQFSFGDIFNMTSQDFDNYTQAILYIDDKLIDSNYDISGQFWDWKEHKISDFINPYHFKTYRIEFRDVNCQCSSDGDTYIVDLTVVDPVSFSLPFSSICANEIKTLSGGVPEGGYYTIDGTVVASFDASKYTGSSKTVVYNYNGLTASKVVAIKSLPTVGLPDFSDVYVDAPPVALNTGSPSGGIYKYNGTTITSFNPASYTPNTYTITYVAQGANSCFNTTSNTITVLQLKEPGEDIPDQQKCKNESPSALVANLNGGKVTINGTVLTNGIFNPASYAVGEYTAVYSRPNFKDDIFKVKVNGLPSVTFNVVSDLCTNSASVNLLTKVSPSGGVFSGSSSTLNPTTLGVGTHKVTYTITDGNGCSNSASRDIVVNNVTAVSLNSFSAVCENGASFNLTGGSPSGGEYFVDGTVLTNGIFNPASYSVGNHTIVYKFTNSENCTTQASQTITVKKVTQANLANIPDLCENDSPYTFIEGSPAGGIYSCIEKADAIANGKFYPSISGDGVFTIRYTYSANGCTDYIEKKIVVNEVTNVTLSTFSSICQNAPAITLTGGSPINGKYLVNGIEKTTFNPSDYPVGNHIITYTFENANGCSNSAQRSIEVKPVTNVSLASIDPICQNGGIFSFSQGTPSNGSYWVNGTKKTSIDPMDYSTGVQNLRYTLTNSQGCTDYDEIQFEIKAAPSVTLNNFAPICQNGSEIDLTGGLPLGGRYIVDGIEKTKFNPSEYTVGEHNIEYIFKNAQGCESSATKTITVLASPTVVLPSFANVYEDDAAFLLSGGSPDKGIYKINGSVETTFSPEALGVGDYTVSYTYTNSNTCTATATKPIKVLALNENVVIANQTVCENGGLKALVSNLYDGKIEINGTELPNGIFNPADYPKGDYVATFSRPNYKSSTFIVSVKAAPSIIFNTIDDLCTSDAPVLLSSKVNIQGGVFSGIGVNGNEFDPDLSKSGLHIITYTASNTDGCSSTIDKNVRVHSLTKVSLNPFSAVCQNAPEFDLIGGFPTGGKYYVDQQEKTKFNPSEYSVGNHTIEYVFENANGCTSSISQIINVKAVTKVTLQDLTDLCENNSPYTFIEGSPSGGIYSCNEKANALANGKIYPNISGAGNFTIRYTKTENGCTDYAEKNIVINELSQVTLAKFDDVCQNEIEFILTGGLPEKGKYLVDGIEQTKFNPSEYSVGNHTVEYVFENANGCTSSTSQIINVKAVTTVNLDAIDPVCQNSGSMNFTQGSPSGGQYLLNGEEKSRVNLSDLSTGLQTLKYTLTNSQSCTDFEEIQFEVKESSTVTLNAFEPICKDANEIDLTGGSPLGGRYIVDGVEQTKFNPQDYAVGNHRIVYEFVNDGKCVDRAEQIITVNASPVVILAYFNDVCQNSNSFELTGGYPANGIYLVNGIEKTTFNPSDYPVGEHTIDYVFKNSNSCSVTATRKIIVLGVPTVTLEDFTPVCENGNPVLLNGGLPLEGKYTNPYLVNGLFRAEIAGSGFHDITYTYKAENGCSASVAKQIQVLEKPTVSIKDYTPVCENGEPIILSGALPVGGTYKIDNQETAIVNPSTLLPGTHTIKYVVEGDNGCTNYVETPLNILPSPMVAITAIDPICQNGNSFQLDNGAPYGGDYLINGSAASILDPSKYDAGIQNLKYTYKNSYGCTSSTSKNFTILEKPEVSLAAQKPVCTNSDPIVLTGGLPVGGTYSGDGVINGEFYPTVGAGTYTIRYTVTNDAGCTDFATTTITVFEAPKVTLERFDDICQNAPEFVLENGFPKGGFYTINEKQVTRFNPADFAPGLHTITYTFENSNGCSSTVSRDIKILAIPTIETVVIPEVCEKSEAFELELKSENNSFSGDYVINNIFHPELSGAGIFDITHSLKNENGCAVSETVKVVVNALPNVTIADFEPICKNGSEITLSGGFPTGGTYFVNGTEASKFNPANFTVGKHIIEYRYSDDKTCENTAQTTITVNAAPVVQLESFDPICQNSGNFTLSGGSPSNGFYLIDGVKKSVINPLDYTIGDHEVIYTFENESGCSNSVSQTLTILENPEITITKFNSVCEDSSPIKLSGGMPLGGVWTGESVVDGVFYPSIGKGSYTLRYTVKNANDCESYKETTITVLSSPVVTFDRLDPVCKNGSEIVLNQGSPSSGSYTLDEQNIKTFNPANHEVGDYTITYSFTNQEGCSSSASRIITVLKSPEVSISSIAPMCQNGVEIDLTGGSPKTGKYYINDIQAVKFNPADHTHGNYEVVYKYALENGCTDFATTTITVLEAPKEPVLETEKVYCPGEEIKLSASVPQGSQLQSTITWLREDYTSLKDNSESVILQSDESFSAYLQCNAENGCKSSVKKVDINVEKIKSNIETNFYEVEQGQALQLQSNVRCDSEIKNYTWEFSDGGISYERNPWHYFNVLGSNDVRLKIQSDNGCNLTTEVTGLVNVIEIPDNDSDTEGIDDLIPDSESNNEALKIGYVFPNPTTGIIRFTTNKEVRTIVQIRNIQGQLVLSNEMNLNGENSLNISNLSTGVYLILIQDKESGEILSSQKVMKK